MELRGVGGETELLVHVRLRGGVHPPKDPRLDAGELDLRLLVSSKTAKPSSSTLICDRPSDRYSGVYMLVIFGGQQFMANRQR